MNPSCGNETHVRVANWVLFYPVILMKVVLMILSVISLNVLYVVVPKIFTMQIKMIAMMNNTMKKTKIVMNAKMDILLSVNLAI